MRPPTLASLTEGLRSTVLRFPVPTLFAGMTTALLVFSIDEGFDDSLLFRFAFLTGLGFVASLLCDLLVEATGASDSKRLAGQIGIVLLLVLYGSLGMPDRMDESRPPFWYGYFILLFALHLGIALVPALVPDGSRKLWRFNLSCFLRYFFSSVNAALLFGGLALALLSVDKLFELGLDPEFYPKLWVLCAFLAHPMLFLGGLPRLRELRDEGEFPKALRFSLCFIGLPLVGLYLLILYAYIGKIVLQWSWPNGWVAMPILILGVISLLTYVLSLPLPQTETWARLYHRWLFRLLLPLSIVLFLALQVRLSDYGMTINRYLGLALAVWLFGISLAFLLRPTLKIGWMPFSLLLVSLFSIYAGPLGAFGWSKRAQIERLRDMAGTLRVMEAGLLVPDDAPKDPEMVAQFQSALRYILENFGAETMADALAGFYEKRGDQARGIRHSRHLGNQIMAYLELNDDLKKSSHTQFHTDPSILPTHGHDWVIDYNFYNHRNRTRSYTIEGTTVDLTIDGEANTLTLTSNDTEIIKIDLHPWADEIKAAVKAHGNRNPKPLVWHKEKNDWRISFVCINARLGSDNTIESMLLKVLLTPPNQK